MTTQTIPQILVTHDYSLFKRLKGNRQVNLAHVEALKKSMKEQPLLKVKPLLVNKNFEVIDGQHRLQAAKELGQPIYYIIEENADYGVAIVLNANSKNWGTGDYIDMFAQQDHAQYVSLMKFIKDNDISLDLGLCMILGQRTSGQFLQNLKNGELKCEFEKIEIAEEIRKSKHLVAFIREKSTGSKSYLSTKNFWIAVKRFMAHEDVDWTYFLSKIEQQHHLLGPKSQIKNYLEIFLYIYNHKKKNKIKMKGV